MSVKPAVEIPSASPHETNFGRVLQVDVYHDAPSNSENGWWIYYTQFREKQGFRYSVSAVGDYQARRQLMIWTQASWNGPSW